MYVLQHVCIRMYSYIHIRTYIYVCRCRLQLNLRMSAKSLRVPYSYAYPNTEEHCPFITALHCTAVSMRVVLSCCFFPPWPAQWRISRSPFLAMTPMRLARGETRGGDQGMNEWPWEAWASADSGRLVGKRWEPKCGPCADWMTGAPQRP